jgi:hypothetical protein
MAITSARRLLGTASLGVLLLAACGGGNDAAPAAETTQPDAPATTVGTTSATAAPAAETTQPDAPATTVGTASATTVDTTTTATEAPTTTIGVEPFVIVAAVMPMFTDQYFDIGSCSRSGELGLALSAIGTLDPAIELTIETDDSGAGTMSLTGWFDGEAVQLEKVAGPPTAQDFGEFPATPDGTLRALSGAFGVFVSC